MAAFSSSTEPRNSPSQPLLGAPKPAEKVGKLTVTTNRLIQAVWSDLEIQCPSLGKLKSLLTYFVTFFALNEIETAAWDFFLLKVLQEHDSLAKHVANLRMAAYYTKSVLGNRMDKYDEKLLEEDANFPTSYAEWLRRSQKRLRVNFHEVHEKYMRLSGSVRTAKKSNNTNTVVDNIVQAVVVTKDTSQGRMKHAEEPPKKHRKVEAAALEICDAPYLPIIPASLDCLYQEDKMFDDIEDLVFDVGKYLS